LHDRVTFFAARRAVVLIRKAAAEASTALTHGDKLVAALTAYRSRGVRDGRQVQPQERTNARGDLTVIYQRDR
jgi:hypothetical protein